MKYKFTCQPDCGKCCTYREDAGFVYLTKEDIFRLEKHLGQRAEEFAECEKFDSTRKAEEPSEEWFLKFGDKQCRFLDGNKCGVYEARPTQCRTFPFWPENMKKTAWKKLKSYCPGIGVGEPLSADVINEKLNEQKKADDES
jgi:Fe-S-cluster containining protein